MTGTVIFGLSLLLGFIIGAVYEGCRRGGSLDLHAELARISVANERIVRHHHGRSVSPDVAVIYDADVRYLYDGGSAS